VPNPKRVGARGCRRDGGGRGSCLRCSGDGSAAGGPACSALCSHVRHMLLGEGLYGAGRARAAAGAATCARPGRAVAGDVRWGVRGVCAGGVGARPRRGLRCRVSAGSLARSLARSLSLSLSPRTVRNGARVRRSSLDKVDRTFHGHKVTKQEHSGMVAHLQTFHAVVDAGCRDAPPRILSGTL
jgi:hypothetical protein